MVELDSDENLLRDHQNRFAKRDIVQFVKYREAIARNNLAEELLKEIPNQVCRYMENIGYKPVPIQTDMQKIEESVKKQLDQIMQRKGINLVDTEAKDVIDKKALYGDTAATKENDELVFGEDMPAPKRKKKKGANKVGAVENTEDGGYFESPVDQSDDNTQPLGQINPSKLPKL